MIKELENVSFSTLAKEVSQNPISVVDIYTDTCGPCKMIKPILENISSDMEDVSFYKLNAVSHRDMAIELGVRSVPTLIAYKDGEEVGRKVGFITKDRIIEWLNDFK